MKLDDCFRSIIETDPAPVVIADLEHTIIYMNPASVRAYEAYGGERLLGGKLYGCHRPESNDKIDRVLEWFAESKEHNYVHTSFNAAKNKDVYKHGTAGHP